MSRKVIVGVWVSLTVNIKEGVEVNDVLDDMNYDFVSDTEGATIEDSKILEYKILEEEKK